MFNTIADVRTANRKLGRHFFDRETMRFFNSKVYPYVYGGSFFITRERYDFGMKEEFAVRYARRDGSIVTVERGHALESAKKMASAFGRMIFREW